MLSRIFKNQTHNPSKQRQADNDHNAIHVQQLRIRASCVYHLYGFLTALDVQRVSDLQVCSIEGPKACHHHQFPVVIEL